MPIVKTDIPMTSARNRETIRQLTARYPFLRSEILTKTAFDRPVIAVTMGTGPRKVLYTAAHHANEWITAPVLLKFAEAYAAAWEQRGNIGGVSARLLGDTVTMTLVPMVNPDGVDLVTGAITEGQAQYNQARQLAAEYPRIPFPAGWKANLLGVDLNLNYPAGWQQARKNKFAQGYTQPGPRDYVGRAPLNQLETRALAELTERLDPDLVLAFHSQGEEIYWQFGDIPVQGARDLGEKLAAASGYRLADTPYLSSFAGFKDWFIQVFRRPGYTVEVGKGENPLPLSDFDSIYDASLGILTTAALGE